MKLRSLGYLLLPALVVTGCSSTPKGDDDDDDDDSKDRCDDPKYGDGVCDTQLGCEAPDIDCFQTFATDAEGATWWRTTGTQLTGVDAPTIAETDPRFTRMRKALDDGWKAFKHARPVGDLKDATPALVLIDLPQISHAAFVVGDGPHNVQPFVVMVETPALELDVSDDAVLGVMMHELQHAVGLHVLGGNGDRLRSFYVAPTDSEPLGRDQDDDADIHVIGDAWRTSATQVGPYSQIELGGYPLRGTFKTFLDTVVAAGIQQSPAKCTDAATKLQAVHDQLGSHVEPLGSALTGDLTPFAAQTNDALLALRDDCLAGETFDVIDVGAEVFGVTRAQFRAQLSADDIALVEGVTFVDGLANIVDDRRTTMREAEGVFADTTGQPFDQLRFFSFEEDADDVSAFVMADAGKDKASLANFFLAVLPPSVADECDGLAGSGFPPYGVDLTDEHHATCWRVGHLRRDPTSDDDRKPTRSHLAKAPHTPARTIRVPHFPKLHTPADNVAD